MLHIQMVSRATWPVCPRACLTMLCSIIFCSRFYPAWAFALPTMVLSIPQAILESGIWSVIVYWVRRYNSTLAAVSASCWMSLQHHTRVAHIDTRLEGGLTSDCRWLGCKSQLAGSSPSSCSCS